MTVTEVTPPKQNNGSEWFSEKYLNYPLDALWNDRYVALEAEFANAGTAWRRITYGCLTRQAETDELSSYDIKSDELQAEFRGLAEQWRRDTKHLSQISKKITHPAFLRIIGMGEAAIPLILEALRDKPAHWFTALRATANTDPSQPDDTPSQAREAWIAWGISRGYIE